MNDEARLLLITADLQLRDEVALIAATVGAALESRPSWKAVAPKEWAVVMCGQDSPPPHPRFARQTLLLGRGDLSQEGQFWETAALHPALRPVPLPAGERWLAAYLGETFLDRTPGQVLALAGAFGATGSSTVAYLLAAELAVRGASVVLLDADPAPGAGIATLLQKDDHLTWARFAEVQGEISSTQLAAGLPATEGFNLVTGGPGREIRQRMLEPVVRSARRVFDYVVIDAGRDYEVLTTALEHFEHLLLVSPCSSRGAAAALEVKSAYPELALLLVANGAGQSGWTPGELSEATGIPLAGDIPEQRWLRRDSQLSTAYELLRSRRGAAYIGTVLEAVDAGAPARHE